MPGTAEHVLVRFQDGCNCCQAVLSSQSARYGLPEDVAVRLATGFGSGMCRGGICGAVSGAVMLLGLAGGGGGPGYANLKVATAARVKDFYARFIERNGSIICRDLIGLDPSTPDGLAQARQENRFATICARLVTDAVSLVQSIIAESDLPDRPSADGLDR